MTMEVGNKKRKRVLYLADGRDEGQELRSRPSWRFELLTVFALHDALACLRHLRIDVVVVEYDLPWHIGVSLLDDLRHRQPRLHRVITGTEEYSADLARLVAIGVAHQYLPREAFARALGRGEPLAGDWPAR